jgi:hypothetical protein
MECRDMNALSVRFDKKKNTRKMSAQSVDNVRAALSD